jgi:hypothetical protein
VAEEDRSVSSLTALNVAPEKQRAMYSQLGLVTNEYCVRMNLVPSYLDKSLAIKPQALHGGSGALLST